MWLGDNAKRIVKINTSSINTLSFISGDKVANKINKGSEYYEINTYYGRI
jgi:hypothetical protein